MALTTSTKAIVGAWALLVIATVVSVGLSDTTVPTARSITILTIAFGKVAIVGLYFMELRTAPRALRYIFTAWCVLTWAVLTAMCAGWTG
jgi:heme/copper-type cytochrome/quinol oxidase subunit 4